MGLKGLYEKCCELHRDPVNLFLHLVAAVVLIYSLWLNSLEGILIGLLIAVIGHIFEEVKKKGKTGVERPVREKPKARRKRKRGALEMSIGTIVIMVIAVTMLILGIVFVRSIMCSGIQMTDKLNEGVMNEIGDLFGSGEYGIKCAGESGNEAKLGGGGYRPVGCRIVSKDNVEYEIIVKSIESLDGASTETVNGWVVDKDWSGMVEAGGRGMDVSIATLDIPGDAPESLIKIIAESTNKESGSKKTHTMRITIVPTGVIKGAMC